MTSDVDKWSRTISSTDSLNFGDPAPGYHFGRDRALTIMLAIAVFFCSWRVLTLGAINLTLTDIALFGCMSLIIARDRLNALPFDSSTPFWLMGLAMMLSGLFISTTLNGDPARWFIVAGQYLFGFLLVPMILSSMDTSLTRRSTAIFVLGVAVSQAIGIAASLVFSFGDVSGIMGDGFITGNGRLGAMTGEPNPNGAAVAFALPMLIYGMRKGFIPKPVAIGCAVPLVWGLLASASFTGFSAALIALVVYLGISGLGTLVRLMIPVVIAVAVFFASGAPLPKAFQERVAGAVSSGDLDQAGTFTDRAALVAEAWQRADDNMLIGMGVDRYRELSAYGAPVHEFHLLIWNEGGVIALFGLVIMLLMLIWLVLGAIVRSRDEGAMAAAVTTVFMIYTLSIPHMYSRMWIMPVMLALSTVYAKRPFGPADI
ncbi:MAG: hypothetical protein ABI668_09080 [Sphingorhabdus sp.]